MEGHRFVGVARVAGCCLTDSISSKVCSVRVIDGFNLSQIVRSRVCLGSLVLWHVHRIGHCGQTSDVLGHVGVVEAWRGQGGGSRDTLWTLMTFFGYL